MGGKFQKYVVRIPVENVFGPSPPRNGSCPPLLPSSSVWCPRLNGGPHPKSEPLLPVEIVRRSSRFLRRPQIRVQPLRGGKAQIDRIRIGILEIVHLPIETLSPSRTISGRTDIWKRPDFRNSPAVFSRILERLTKKRKFRYPCRYR